MDDRLRESLSDHLPILVSIQDTKASRRVGGTFCACFLLTTATIFEVEGAWDALAEIRERLLGLHRLFRLF